MRIFELHTEAAWPVMAFEAVPEQGPILGCVQIIHGMTEHMGNYELFSQVLVSAGFVVYGLDLRGHGQSAGRVLGALGKGADWSNWVADEGRLFRLIQDRHPGLPIFVFGHSMGSYIAQDFLTEQSESVAGLILSGTSLESRFMVGLGWFASSLVMAFLGELGSGALFYRIIYGGLNRPFQPARTPFDWLCRDSEAVDTYIADPKCGFIPPIGFYQVFFKGLFLMLLRKPWMKISSKLPIAVFAGGEDSLGKQTRSVLNLVHVYRETGHRVSVHIYPQARHVLLAEQNKKEVMTDIIGWLRSQLV